MTHGEFSHILASIPSLSPDQMRQLARELESRVAATAQRAQPSAPTPPADAQDTDGETAFDVASRSGLIGCIKGAPGSPTDRSTNPKHMEGFGRG